MQTTTLHNPLNNSISIITLLFLAALSAPIQAEESLGDLALLDTADKWQVNRLFEPTNHQRKKEFQGQIILKRVNATALVDMTTGSVRSKLILLAWPVMLSHLLQTFYLLVL